MKVLMPTIQELRAVAKQCGLSLDDPALASFRSLLVSYIDSYNEVAAMPEEVPVVKYPRSAGFDPFRRRTDLTPGT